MKVKGSGKTKKHLSKWLDVYLIALGGLIAQASVNPWYRFDYWLLFLLLGVIIVVIGSVVFVYSRSSSSEREAK